IVRADRKPFDLRWDLEGAREEVALSLCVFQKVPHVFSPSSNDLCREITFNARTNLRKFSSSLVRMNVSQEGWQEQVGQYAFFLPHFTQEYLPPKTLV